MTVLDAIKENGSSQFLFKQDIDAAQSQLQLSEEVLFAATTTVDLNARAGYIDPNMFRLKGRKPGVVVLTNERLFYIHALSKTTIQIPILELHSIETKVDGFSACIRITGSKECFIIYNSPSTISALKIILESILSQNKRKCPYCDSRLDPQDNHHTCPHCGGPLTTT